MAKGEVLRDPVNVGGAEYRCVAQGPAAFGIFGLEQMSPARAAKQNLARGGYLESFGYRFSGLITSGSSHIYLLFWLSAGAVMRPGRVYVQVPAFLAVTQDDWICAYRLCAQDDRVWYGTRRVRNGSRGDYGLMINVRVLFV
jgi:hypothetical protein